MNVVRTIIFLVTITLYNNYAETLGDEKFKNVFVSINVLDIIKIDDANQRIAIDFVVKLSWMDKELLNRWKEKTVVNKNGIWTPEIQIFNDYSLEKKLKDQFEVNVDGSVSYRQRFVGEINSKHNFSEFPLDDFILKIQIISIIPDMLFINKKDSTKGHPFSYSISGWKINSEWMEINPDDERFKNLPHVTYFISAQRMINYYIWKIIIPLAMVVFMSWLVFWVDPIQIGAQLTVGATAMLTMIAYQFTLSNLIPPVSYLTRLDTFILGSNVIVFIALLEAILTSNLVSHDKKTIARRIDYLSRFIFPVGYTMVFIKSFWI
jgi:hypothetical protein